MKNWRSCVSLALLAIFAMAAQPGLAQKKAKPVKSLRVYLFDCGMIKGSDPAPYHVKLEDLYLKSSDMVVPCYLIVHPKGTLMWDVGLIPDSAFKGGNGPVVINRPGATTISSPKPLLPQLAAIGYRPEDITYLALSHYHFDHVANANAFAGSTWLVHATEREAMFAVPPERQTAYDQLKNSKTVILPNTDYDVFGDGTVVIKYAPGHTPGHQVLFLKLPKTGPVLIAGDLWHYPQERSATEAPRGDPDKPATMASRAAMEAYLKQSGAQLWIEHDVANFNRLQKAPAYIQ